jgi:arylsulfatase A-like enzyme
MHGGSAGLLRGGKGMTFEGGMRTPAIFWWPGRLKPGVQMEMGATLDLLPTFCALAEAAPPADRTLDGYNLAPVLLGETDESPREGMFYWRQDELYAVRVGPWKAHFVIEGSYDKSQPRRDLHAAPELYHLEFDPSEEHNVAGDHPDVVERLTKIADEHRQGIEPVENQLDKR